MFNWRKQAVNLTISPQVILPLPEDDVHRRHQQGKTGHVVQPSLSVLKMNTAQRVNTVSIITFYSTLS